MDVRAFLDDLRASPDYADQIAYVREVPAQEARFAAAAAPLPPPVLAALAGRGIEQLYSHQAQAIDAVRAGENVILAAGTASGKSLCYVVPVLEMLASDPLATALLLFPTKALTQDQSQSFAEALKAAGLGHVLAGVYDGDTPTGARKKLRDGAAVIFTNPDMLHTGIMPQHARWSRFFQGLKLVVLDEIHTYNGMFGSNTANLMRRFLRVCHSYGCDPQLIASSATIGNPQAIAEELTGKPFTLIADDGSPRGKRTYVLWNPPRTRPTEVRSRRSANVEAHELMVKLIRRGIPTITFSKAKMTAELICRYVWEALARDAPRLAEKVMPYRGGYLPAERREIEKKLFSGELMGVSTTPALELGVDVGSLDACILVGYPGTLSSFMQQSGRAGRREDEALIILVGLDTTVNQYVMAHPEYLFARAIEQAVIDPDNPFITMGHLRCAAHEMAITDGELPLFGPQARVVVRILEEQQKLRHLNGRWYHASTETPQFEVPLRTYAEKNIVIQDADTHAALGEVNEFDALPIVHNDAIYMHFGDTYRVLNLDLEKNIATVRRVETDYYTQPMGGTDVHHVDHRLREKPFGTGTAYWGEVTAFFEIHAFERIHFYSLDAISEHPLELPTFWLDTMAFWLVPPDDLLAEVTRAGMNAHNGLRAIGYATRMLLPLFITCQTADFSHSVGCLNSPWSAVFIYERYRLGLGFTEKAYERLHEIMPAVLDNLKTCPCRDGCPVCVGKPLRQFTTWNVERGEASVPSKQTAIMLLEGLLGDGSALQCPETVAPASQDDEEALASALRRRLERMREPGEPHPIALESDIRTEYPAQEDPATLSRPDSARRLERGA